MFIYFHILSLFIFILFIFPLSTFRYFYILPHFIYYIIHIYLILHFSLLFFYIAYFLQYLCILNTTYYISQTRGYALTTEYQLLMLNANSSMLQTEQ
jgi:hypothetical protein